MVAIGRRKSCLYSHHGAVNVRVLLSFVRQSIYLAVGRNPGAPDNGLQALSRVWWFMALTAWDEELSKDSVRITIFSRDKRLCLTRIYVILQAYKQRVVEILLKFTGCVSVVRSNPNHNFSWLPCSPTNNEGTRRQTFQLLYRLSNTPSWSDVLDFVRSTILRLMESLLNVYSEHPPRNIYDICRVLSVSSPFSFMVFESQTS